jgi:hypothetical protein
VRARRFANWVCLAVGPLPHGKKSSSFFGFEKITVVQAWKLDFHLRKKSGSRRVEVGAGSKFVATVSRLVLPLLK